MKVVPKKSPEDKTSQEKKGPQSIPLNGPEQARLDDLMFRFQELVVLRNRRSGERVNANVTLCDIMRAGMMALKDLTDDEFRLLVLRAKDRE